jgi:hypothetical protein
MNQEQHLVFQIQLINHVLNETASTYGQNQGSMAGNIVIL